MDRIIEVKVGGNYLTKDNKNAGVRGEANVTSLRITFDEGWDNYAKTVTFWDARGQNPVERILTTDLLENKAESIRVYLVPIPGEPMAEAGSMTFVIDGYIEGKRQRSMSDKLEVKDAPIADNAEEPIDPIPKPYEQFQEQIDAIKKDIQDISTDYRIYYSEYTPIVYCKVVGDYVEYTLRYLVDPRKARYVHSSIWKHILLAHQKGEIKLYNKNVEYNMKETKNK